MTAFKRYEFTGEVARARMEIAWAEDGLALIDDLERCAAPLATPPPTVARGRRRTSSKSSTHRRKNDDLTLTSPKRPRLTARCRWIRGPDP
jgi:PadR family transcriptional regulator, regulator of vanillate utilization